MSFSCSEHNLSNTFVSICVTYNKTFTLLNYLKFYPKIWLSSMNKVVKIINLCTYINNLKQ